MTMNTEHFGDYSWSLWHRLFGKVYVTDLDQLIFATGESMDGITVEYDYLNNEEEFVALIDHKSGAGHSAKSTNWSPMKLQLKLARKLDIPFFLSIDYLLPQFAEPCSYMIGCNSRAKTFLAKYTTEQGLWLPPYHICWFLHQLRNKTMNDAELIDPKGKHVQVPALKELIEKYNLKTLGDLPKKLTKYNLPEVRI